MQDMLSVNNDDVIKLQDCINSLYTLAEVDMHLL